LIKRIVFMAAAAAAFAAAAGVCVVALAYALFAVARDYLSPAGSAAVVAAAFAVLIAVGGLVLSIRSRPKPPPEQSPVERLVDLARQKPLMAAAVAVAGAVIAVRNPAMVATLVMGLLAPKPDRRR
jgi:cobalamin synthase